MKKKQFSLVTALLLILVVVLPVYFFSYFQPAQQELAQVQAELTLANHQVNTYLKYLGNEEAIQADIEAIQAEIDAIHQLDYISDSTVGKTINDAIGRFKITLSSISLESKTSYGDASALPIFMKISGQLDNVMAFVDHFEQHSDGSFIVSNISMGLTANENCEAELVLYLCTPKV